MGAKPVVPITFAAQKNHFLGFIVLWPQQDNDKLQGKLALAEVLRPGQGGAYKVAPRISSQR